MNRPNPRNNGQKRNAVGGDSPSAKKTRTAREYVIPPIYERKGRTIFSERQLRCLNGVFQKNQYPDGHLIARICRKVQLVERCVRVWFRNKRYLQKREKLGGPVREPFRMGFRTQTKFSAYQLEKLERAYERNQLVDSRRAAKLARRTDLTETLVKVWFMNRRARSRKQQRAASAPPKAPDVKKVEPPPQRRRTVFTPDQLSWLESVFQERQYPHASIMAELERRTFLTEKQIRTWFNNRRAKWRKQQKETGPSPPPYTLKTSRDEMLRRVDKSISRVIRSCR